MQLSIADRLLLLGVLPHEGDITTLKIVRKLKDDLSFAEDEHKILNFKEEDGKLFWNPDAKMSKDVEIGEKATDVIVTALKELNSRHKLREELMPLYELFVSKE